MKLCDPVSMTNAIRNMSEVDQTQNFFVSSKRQSVFTVIQNGSLTFPSGIYQLVFKKFNYVVEYRSQ